VARTRNKMAKAGAKIKRGMRNTKFINYSIAVIFALHLMRHF